MSITYQKRIDLPNMDFYPLFIDYDFANSRPRGGSACIDFFAFGKLCALMDNIEEGTVYVQKDSIMPRSGFFLLDFSKVFTNPDSLKEIIVDLNVKQIYLEDSERFSLDKFMGVLEDIQVMMVSFRA